MLTTKKKGVKTMGLKKFKDSDNYNGECPEYLVAYEPRYTSNGDIAYYEPLNFLVILNELDYENSEDIIATDAGYGIEPEWENVTNTNNHIILVNPDNKKAVAIAEKLNHKMLNEYPILDDEWARDYEQELIQKAWDNYLEDDIYEALNKYLDPKKLPDFYDRSLLALDLKSGNFTVPEDLQPAFYEYCINGCHCETLQDVGLNNGYGIDKLFCVGIESELLQGQNKLNFERSPYGDIRQSVLFDPEFLISSFEPFDPMCY